MNANFVVDPIHAVPTGAVTTASSLKWLLSGFVAVTSLIAPVTQARITSITIDCARSQSPTFCPGQSPTFGGMSFGAVGQYEKLRGTARGEVDPLDPRNAVITDIALAPRNARGNVEYSTDIFILKPVNLKNGNHRLFLDYNNRGEMRLGRLNEVELSNDPSTAAHAGNGFVMSLGYTIVSMGWDFGASGADSLKISLPVAKNPVGSASPDITGPSYEYIVVDNAKTISYRLAYPAATLDKSQATLTVRARLNDAPVQIEANGWEYASPTSIRLLPAGTPFTRSAIYEFKYTAKDPVVAGLGLAATRDVISFLRHATTGNPLAGDVKHTFSYSISQPSRALNDFQMLGFNEDEDGRRVIDGILSHTAGGSGVQINYRFAQPARTERNRQNHLYPEGVFPFAHPVLTDHLSGKTAGRSARCMATNTCPMRFEVNTSNEYWVKAGSLLHTDTQGNDLKDPENVRFYLLSGLSHGVGDSADRKVCQQFTNAVSPYPTHRALLVALDKWVSDGTSPPRSEVPRRADGTGALTVAGAQTGIVPQKELGWPTIPGVTYTGLITTRYFLDFGPKLAHGVVANYPPVVSGRPSYPIYVPRVDRDGNEVPGVRLPPVAAPVATTTGWAHRAPEFGGPDGCESDGQHIPFAVTRAQREAAGDPRLSLEERYKNHEGYVAAVAKAAAELERRRFLLPADARRYIEEAQASNVLKSSMTAARDR
jgi:Alpha/beta hydrolase domain